MNLSVSDYNRLIISIILIFLVFALLQLYLYSAYGDEKYLTASGGQYFRTERSKQCEGIDVSEMIVSQRVIGRSMLPTMDSQSKLLIVSYNTHRPLVEGDIVMVKDKYTHRITGVYKDYVMTKGDNNLIEDSDKSYYGSIDYIVCGVLRV